MTKEEVLRTFKKTYVTGYEISKAVNTYFKEQIALKNIKPMEYYKPKWNIKDSGFKEAQKVFSY